MSEGRGSFMYITVVLLLCETIAVLRKIQLQPDSFFLIDLALMSFCYFFFTVGTALSRLITTFWQCIDVVTARSEKRRKRNETGVTVVHDVIIALGCQLKVTRAGALFPSQKFLGGGFY